MNFSRKPRHDLARFKAQCGDTATLAMTKTAADTAAEAGFDRHCVAKVVRSMEAGHFYKSMTSYHNKRQWQDVYHVPWEGEDLYVKLTDGVIAEFLMLSFKPKEK